MFEGGKEQKSQVFVYQTTQRHHPGNVLLLVMYFMIYLHYSQSLDFRGLNVSDLQLSA